MFLGLNLVESYDSPPALALLAKDEDDLLQPFRNSYIDLPEASSAQVEELIRAEQQTTSLVRGMLELAGGRVERQQHVEDQEYTARDNAGLCGSLIGITGTNQFGNFDLKQMHNALLKSKIFAGDPDISTFDPAIWSEKMMAYLPIGFQEGYLVRYLKLRSE